MFLRHTTRKKNGKEHRYYSLVENRRVASGRVVQRHARYLGEINDSQQEAWRKTIEIFEEGQARPRTVALFPEERIGAVDDADIVRIRLSKISCSVPIGQWITLELQYTNATLNILVNSNSILHIHRHATTAHQRTSGLTHLAAKHAVSKFLHQYKSEHSFQLATNSLSGGVSGMWNPVSTGTVSGQLSMMITWTLGDSLFLRINFQPKLARVPSGKTVRSSSRAI